MPDGSSFYTATDLQAITAAAPDQTDKFISGLQPLMKANASVGLDSITFTSISDSGLKSSVQTALEADGFLVSDSGGQTTVSWALS